MQSGLKNHIRRELFTERRVVRFPGYSVLLLLLYRRLRSLGFSEFYSLDSVLSGRSLLMVINPFEFFS